MIGQHADVVIVDAFMKKVGDFDVQTAYQAMKAAATTTRQVIYPIPYCSDIFQHNSRADLQDWLKLGCRFAFVWNLFVILDVAYDVSDVGVCETLAYSY